MSAAPLLFIPLAYFVYFNTIAIVLLFPAKNEKQGITHFPLKVILSFTSVFGLHVGMFLI